MAILVLITHGASEINVPIGWLILV